MRHCSTAKKDFRSNRPKRAYFRQMADMRENKGDGLCLTQPPSFAPAAPFVSEDEKKRPQRVGCGRVLLSAEPALGIEFLRLVTQLEMQGVAS